MSEPSTAVSVPRNSASPASLFGVVRDVVEQMRRTSGADILSLYLYDAETRAFYAPASVGPLQEDLGASIADMQDQLNHYLADVEQGKAPQELSPKHYGPNVWLTVTRQRLYAKDAPKEIDSSFIRRYHVQSVLGLPLQAGDRLVGLLYLNFCSLPEGGSRAVPKLDTARLTALEQAAGEAARAIERAREAEERAAFVATTELASSLGTPTVKGSAGAADVRGQVERGLDQILAATGFEAALVYQLGARQGQLDLVAASGIATAPVSLEAGEAEEIAGSATLKAALADAGQHLVAGLALRHDERLHGWLVLASSDQLAVMRRAPAGRLLLQTAANLIAGALVGQRLIATLEDTNRVLSALSRMSSALLRPGATPQEVLEAVVRHMTNAQVPEFDFQFATAYLLEGISDTSGERLVVRVAAGAATGAAIDASPVAGMPAAEQAARLVPRWVQTPNRALTRDDILGYVARRWQVVVVGAGSGNGQGRDGEDLIVGFPADHLRQQTSPAVRSDGQTVAVVPVILVGPSETSGDGVVRDNGVPPFTLDGDIYQTSGHGDLVRVFVPFGLDTEGAATGVLEAGYHRAHKRQLERAQIEALRNGAAQVAVAVETARLYEDVKRHAEQVEISADVSKAIAASIDLDQTLRLVAGHLVRLVDASLCQIALYEEDGSAWFGAAASGDETLWRRQRGERPEVSFLFEVLDRREPLVIEDAQNHELVSPYYARRFGIRSLIALPLLADDQPIGAAVLAQCDRQRGFSPEEVHRTSGLAHQAAIAIKNARLHAYTEEERHLQKDVVLIGLGQWGLKAYQHLLTLKQFFNFKTHVVVPDRPGRREQLASREQEVLINGDAFYWDHPDTPARDQLRRALESSCYVITYIATPAATHLPVLAEYYDLSNVVVIEKPLGAPPEAYRAFLESVEGGVEIVAADHYYFKLEVRLLQVLLTEERTLKAFVESVDEIELELLEERPLTGAAAEIGIIADMLPHAFAILSLFTPIDRIQFGDELPLLLGRQEPLQGKKETFARLTGSFPHHGRTVRLIITMGKGVENAKWIKLSGEKRPGNRRAFYKFDFVNGVAVDGTQTNLRAAERGIREAGVPDNAHLTMMRHVIEKRHPAVGILAIREAMRSNQRIQELEALADDLLARGDWTSYRQGQRPAFAAAASLRWLETAEPAEAAVSSDD